MSRAQCGMENVACGSAPEQPISRGSEGQFGDFRALQSMLPDCFFYATSTANSTTKLHVVTAPLVLACSRERTQPDERHFHECPHQVHVNPSAPTTGGPHETWDRSIFSRTATLITRSSSSSHASSSSSSPPAPLRRPPDRAPLALHHSSRMSARP